MTTIPFCDLSIVNRQIYNDFLQQQKSILDNSDFIGGDQIYRFEESFSRALEIKYCHLCANGTDALFIALKALGIDSSSEVITTAHSWISSSEAISLTGAQPVFCDIDPSSFNIDPTLLIEKISPKTKAILAVHIYGNPADLKMLRQIANHYNLFLIEDCAQAHFATYDNQFVGTFGDVSTFSFFPTKNLGAFGDAGAICTNSQSIYSFAKSFSQHGGKNIHIIEGINSRCDALQALVLNLKLPHMPNWTKERQVLARQYNELLQNFPNIKTPSSSSSATHVYHLYTLQCERRDELLSHLKALNVDAAIKYPQFLPFLPAYKHFGHNAADFPIAFKTQQSILSLPFYIGLSYQDQVRISTIIQDFYS